MRNPHYLSAILIIQQESSLFSSQATLGPTKGFRPREHVRGQIPLVGLQGVSPTKQCSWAKSLGGARCGWEAGWPHPVSWNTCWEEKQDTTRLVTQRGWPVAILAQGSYALLPWLLTPTPLVVAGGFGWARAGPWGSRIWL